MTIDLSTIKVLVVDDKPPMRMIIRTILNSMGIRRIVEAADGRHALDIVSRANDKSNAKGKKPPFELIICDWIMPEMTGLEVLQALRENEQLSKIPFLMVTSQNDRDQVSEAIDSGVNDYVIKPFNAKTLQIKVQRMLARK